MTNATRVSRRIDTNCVPSVESRTCRFGSTLKFPHIKFYEKKGSMPDVPFRTHNKQAGKRIFTIPTKWNMRNPSRDFTSYYSTVKNKFIIIKFYNSSFKIFGVYKILFPFLFLDEVRCYCLRDKVKIVVDSVYFLIRSSSIGRNPLFMTSISLQFISWFD